MTLHASKYAISLVGRTVDSVSFRSSIEGDPQLTTIYAPMVDAIRSGEELQIGSMEKMVVRVDGLVSLTGLSLRYWDVDALSSNVMITLPTMTISRGSSAGNE